MSYFLTQLDRKPELMRGNPMLDGGYSSADRVLQREVRRNTVQVKFPPEDETYTGVVVAVKPAIDEIDDVCYLVWREKSGGVRVWIWGYQGYFIPHRNPRIYPRHTQPFQAVWVNEKDVRFIDGGGE